MSNIILDRKLNYTIFEFIHTNLKIGTSFKAGHNFTGKICVYHRSSGYKRNYLFIDFFRRINNFGIIYKILIDSNRTAFLAAIIYDNGLFSHIISSGNLKIGERIYSGYDKKIETLLYYTDVNMNGFALPIFLVNILSVVNNIEFFAFSGSILSRAAGSGSILAKKK